MSGLRGVLPAGRVSDEREEMARHAGAIFTYRTPRDPNGVMNSGNIFVVE